MSIEIVSLGNFDYSLFNLSFSEEFIISHMVKYDISSYHVTKDIFNNTIEFLMNSSSLGQEKANTLFSTFFDCLEKEFSLHQQDNFSIFILNFSFIFSRVHNNINNPYHVSWIIDCENIDKIKIALFTFFHKNLFYQHLEKKLTVKNIKISFNKI